MESKKFHATSVVLEENGIMILGKPGSGKSDLALRLIDNGATLVSDDLTICKKIGENIFLFSTEEIRGLLEVREIGIITVPYVEKVRLKMITELTNNDNERLPKPKSVKILGVRIPKLNINGKNPSAVAKVKLKLNEINKSL